ncbi:hypothetical protein EV715DRAFT_272335 [Schizophyllum commune]
MGPTMSLAVLGRSRNTSIRVRREAAFARCAGSSCRHLYTDELSYSLRLNYTTRPLSCSLLCIVSRALALYDLHPHCVVVVGPGLVALSKSARKYERVLLTGCLALHTVCDGCYRIR